MIYNMLYNAVCSTDFTLYIIHVVIYNMSCNNGNFAPTASRHGKFWYLDRKVTQKLLQLVCVET